MIGRHLIGTMKDALIQFMMKVKYHLSVIAVLIGIIFHAWIYRTQKNLSYGFAGSAMIDYLTCINSTLNDECCFYDNDNNKT